MSTEGRDDPLERLEEKLGYRFADRELLLRAVTHRSWSVERGEPRSYERLEFLGDAVLGMVTARWLFEEVQEPEGELSKRKAHLVSAPRLAEYARRIDLGRCLRLGVGEERSGGRRKESLLADALEAVIAAVYLDGGIAPTREVVEPFLEEETRIEEGGPRTRDPKTALQEILQARERPLPEYEVVEEVGPDHAKVFHVEVRVGGDRLASGTGTSKKRAEQAAAAQALDRLLES